MSISRRDTLRLATGLLGGIGLSGVTSYAARAEGAGMEGDVYSTDGGEIRVHPVSHASFVMTTPGLVIYNDPVNGAAAYESLPAPDLILVTHEHGDHFVVDTLNGIVGENTRLVVNPAVFGMLPEDLKARATGLANGESTEIGGVSIEAVPAYNTTEDRLKYHPQGRDNGYVLEIDGMRVYIAGDTEDIPEMRALESIDIAFVPMNLPYTMSVEQAAAGVAAFAPKHVYPYHYNDSDVGVFADLVAESGAAIEVVMGGWYA
jgi:L-ascorbate metabolism protein UlaG (beta-lactamase superfamily)